jgi:hypothetical protein
MMTFPLSESAQFVVIEPGNIRRLKEGRPLTVDLPNGSSVMISFVPDMAAFAKELGLDPSVADVPRNSRHEARVHITPEQIQIALEKAAKWPEVER